MGVQRRFRRALALTLVLVAAASITAAAQRRGFFGGGMRFRTLPNAEYDGRFTFVRTYYDRYGGWAADYPTMERNLTQILREITSLRPWTDASNVHTFDDPELLKYPVAYLSEPGYWFPTDGEVEGLRQYLAEGRLPHRGRLPLPERVGGVRCGHAPRAAVRAARSAAALAPDLPHLLRNRLAGGPVSGPAGRTGA